MENADIEKRPETNKKKSKEKINKMNIKCCYINNSTSPLILTAQNEINTSNTGDLPVGSFTSSDFGAFHSKQGKCRTKETQTDGRNHQSPACVEVTCKHKTELSAREVKNSSFYCLCFVVLASISHMHAQMSMSSRDFDWFTHQAKK